MGGFVRVKYEEIGAGFLIFTETGSYLFAFLRFVDKHDMTFFYLCIQFCSQVTRLPQTRVCTAGVVTKSMGTFSCAKDLTVKFNGFRMFFFLALHETIVQLSVFLVLTRLYC